MFRVVKYLNHVHPDIYDKISVAEAASELLTGNGIRGVPRDPGPSAVRLYRSMERDN